MKKDTPQEVEHKKYRKYRKKVSEEFYLSKRVKKIILKDLKIKKEKSVKYTNKEKFLDDFGSRFSQMESSYDKLERFLIFISSTSSSIEKRGVSRADQFVYHIENYISSVYIFEQRLKKLVGYIDKIGNKLGCDATELKKLKSAHELLSKTLEPMNIIRGKHIHDRPYYDDGLYRLELFANAFKSASTEEEKRQLKGYLKITLLFQRHDWKKTIRENNKVTETLLGIIYKPLFKLKKEIYKKIK